MTRGEAPFRVIPVSDNNVPSFSLSLSVLDFIKPAI